MKHINRYLLGYLELEGVPSLAALPRGAID